MTELEAWRQDEHRVEGGWFGGEFPRLWPPRCGCGCTSERWSPCVLACCVTMATRPS